MGITQLSINVVKLCSDRIIQYSSGAWGNRNFKNCEDVILRACWFYCGVHRLTPKAGIQGDIGWLGHCSKSILEIIRLYNRFLKMDDNRLNKKIFLWDKSLCKDNWSMSLQNLLNDLNLENFWINSTSIPMDLAKTRVWDRLERDWRHHCSTMDKLRTYRIHKHDMIVAAHLT